MSTTAIIAVGVILLVGSYVWLRRFETRRYQSIKDRALDHMAGRPRLNPEEFAARCFEPDVAPVARRIREMLPQHLEIDLSQMQPTDELVADLRMDALDSMSTAYFLLEIEDEFKIKIPDADAEAMRTLEDLALYVAEEVKRAKRG